MVLVFQVCLSNTCITLFDQNKCHSSLVYLSQTQNKRRSHTFLFFQFIYVFSSLIHFYLPFSFPEIDLHSSTSFNLIVVLVLLLLSKVSCGLPKQPGWDIRWVIGNGEKIRFWKNNWLGTSSLAIQYWKLYRFVNEKNRSVASFMGWCRP